MDLLRAKTPKEARPEKRRTKATRNWEFFPTVGRKGEASCQTSRSFESIEEVRLAGDAWALWCGKFVCLGGWGGVSMSTTASVSVVLVGMESGLWSVVQALATKQQVGGVAVKITTTTTRTAQHSSSVWQSNKARCHFHVGGPLLPPSRHTLSPIRTLGLTTLLS